MVLATDFSGPVLGYTSPPTITGRTSQASQGRPNLLATVALAHMAFDSSSAQAASKLKTAPGPTNRRLQIKCEIDIGQKQAKALMCAGALMFALAK